MKRLDPAIQEEDDDSDSDWDDDEQEQPENDSDENAPARANVVAGAEAEPEGLGSIAVKDGPSEQKKEELRAFLVTELPEIQRNVALRARTLWWKQKEFDGKVGGGGLKLCVCVALRKLYLTDPTSNLYDLTFHRTLQLEDARNKLKDVQKLIEAIEPGIPSMTEAAAVPTV